MNPVAFESAFEPKELAFLQRFFKEICVERGVAGGSPDANDLAVRIIDLYQQGIRDERALQSQLSGQPAGHG